MDRENLREKIPHCNYIHCQKEVGKMKHWKWVSWALCLFLIGFVAFTRNRTGDELNYSVFFPAPHKNAVLATEWAKEIEKRTGGKVQITVFPGGTLTPADKCYDGVVKGLSDIGFSVLAYTRGKFPLTEVADLPVGAKSALASTKLINEFYKKFKPKELDGSEGDVSPWPWAWNYPYQKGGQDT